MSSHPRPSSSTNRVIGMSVVCLVIMHTSNTESGFCTCVEPMETDNLLKDGVPVSQCRWITVKIPSGDWKRRRIGGCGSPTCRYSKCYEGKRIKSLSASKKR
ncbi:hypothetical protein DENSPDRAFT_104196 [Dentipellis sp. KUC8613]|nr:hypothetical protein DENSPDRAFT_104196 [Dentipellis sp. KUC8613]